MSVIIPALNEEAAIGKVVNGLKSLGDFPIVVVDNGSTDQTAAIAKKAGAFVVKCSDPGYGPSCLRGVEYASRFSNPYLGFIDGDFSDEPKDFARLYNEIIKKQLDFVLGSRVRLAAPGALTLQARFGNWLATNLLALLFPGPRYTDLGPMRIIRAKALEKMKMSSKKFAWTVEMQIKSNILDLRSSELSVSYRQRIGKSKISGTIKGVLGAGFTILSTILKYKIIYTFKKRCSL